mgnify:CR=1 FL=1
MKYIKYSAYVLTLVGALNWGLVGLFGIDLVASIFGDMTLLSRIVYSLVGLSAIASAYFMYNCDRRDINSCEYGHCNF